MKKASSLPEANTLMEEVKKWQAESVSLKQVLDNGNAAAQKMTMHDEADKTYAENVKKWEVVDKCIKDWILKMEALVKMWTDQAGKEYTSLNIEGNQKQINYSKAASITLAFNWFLKLFQETSF